MRSFVIIAVAMLIFSYYSYAQASCDYKVEILVDGDEFEKEDFKWKMKVTKLEGKSTNITGTAEIEADDKTIKKYKPWTTEPISRQKTSSEYSPNLKVGIYKINTEINVECDDINKDNNVDTKTITIKDSSQETVKIKNKDQEQNTKNEKSAAFIGESTESEAQTTTTSEKPKIQESQTTSGQKKPKNLSNKSTKADENIIYLSQNKNQVQGQVVQSIIYKSSSERLKDFVLIFLLALSILLNIILIWKR